MEKNNQKQTNTVTKPNQESRLQVNQRNSVEKKRHDLHNHYTAVIDSMPTVLIGVDSNCTITLWNQRAEQLTGISARQAIGKQLTDVRIPEFPDDQAIRQCIQDRETIRKRSRPKPEETPSICRDITIYPLLDTTLEGAVIRIEDVTDWVRMEEMMVQSEKMLSVSGLTAGMAHKINNPLAGIIQTSGVMATRLSKKSTLEANQKAAEEAGTTIESIDTFMRARGIPRMLEAINESARRVAGIIADMLDFTRRSERIFPHDLNELTEKTLGLAASDYDLNKHYDFKLIKIVRQFEENLPVVDCERGKIQQVLLNILRNGAQAMHMAKTPNPSFIIRSFTDIHRQMAGIEILDNGPGMDESVRNRVFEPFFTTKDTREGSGLGLSVSYFIITMLHRGEIEVASKPGAGTKFTIRLPLR